MNLLPDIDQCAMIAGTRGRGKTFLARWLLDGIDGYMPRFVFDLKGEDQLLLPGCLICYDPDTAYRSMYSGRDVLYRPQAQEDRTHQALDDMVGEVYECGNVHTYIDEMGRFVSSSWPKSGLLDIFSRGRQRSRNGFKVYSPIIWSTQRPAFIPLHAYTETDVFYVLWLRSLQDRKKIVEYTDGGFIVNPSQKYGFRFLSPKLDQSVEYGPLKVVRLPSNVVPFKSLQRTG